MACFLKLFLDLYTVKFNFLVYNSMSLYKYLEMHNQPHNQDIEWLCDPKTFTSSSTCLTPA